MQANKLLAGNPKDVYRLGLLKAMLSDAFNNLPIFHFGEVVLVDKKANRLKVRIPLLDDVFYIDENNGNLKQGAEAIKENVNLPWCITNKRFTDYPELGCIVLVALFDNKNPYKGRLFLTELGSDDESKEVYEAYLQPMLKLREQGWENAENLIGIRYNNSPIRDKTKFPRHYQSKANNEVGILGKGDNRILLKENSIEIVQNVNKPQANQSKFDISEEKVDLKSANEINILSEKGSTKYNPVFDDPLFDFLTEMLNTMSNLHNVLLASPYLVASAPGPVTPQPTLVNFKAQITSLKAKLQNFKAKGSSKNININ